MHARTPEALREVTAAVEEIGAEVLAVAGDVRSEEDLAAAVAAITERFGRLDGIVAGVGGAAPGPLAEIDARALPAPARPQPHLGVRDRPGRLPAAARGARGAAVLVSATATTSATPLFGAYGAAKAGVEHLTRSLAAEWGPEVRVNCVSPGLIRTEGSMQAVFRGSEELAAKAGRTTAVGRIGDARGHRLRRASTSSATPPPTSRATTLVVDGGPTEGPTQRILRALEG